MRDLEARREVFAAHAPAWLVVRHFLSASLLCELFSAIVSQWSAGKLTLDQVADISISTGDPTLASIAFKRCCLDRPMRDEGEAGLDQLADSLSELIELVIWQGDQTLRLRNNDKGDPYSVTHLDLALELSNRDLGTIAQSSDRLMAADVLEPLVEAMLQLRETIQAGSPIEAGIAVIEASLARYGDGPIVALLLKHLGDLAGDSDHWDAATPLYLHAAAKLTTLGDAWTELRQSLAPIIGQSHAAAIRVTHGPDAAASILDQLARHDAPGFLQSLNMDFDRMAAHLAAGNFDGYQVRRGSVLLAPQLISAHHQANALGNLVDGRHDDANRWFWATLRRQVALGSATVSRETRSGYARSIIEQLETALGQRHDADNFYGAIRLLVESGRDRAAEAIDWREQLLGVYLTPGLIDRLVALANRHAGARAERHRVLVVLLREWLKALPADSSEVAARAFALLGEIAERFEHSGFAERNIGGSAMTALRTLGRQRPDLAFSAADQVVAALLRIFSEASAFTASSALEAIAPYTRYLSLEARAALAEQILDRLDRTPPSDNILHRNALDLLSSQQMIALTNAGASGVGERLSRTLVSLSLHAGVDKVYLMYLLRDLDRAAVADVLDETELSSIIERLGEGANQVNSSGAAACVQALLVAPSFSGRAGVEAALTGLERVIDHIGSSRHGFGASDAYDPLILVSHSHAEIASTAAIPPPDMRALLDRLEAPICRLWESAAERPALFNGFALPPPTEPNRVLVHNWAFASLAYAKAMGRQDAIRQALGKAALHPSLGPYMAMAQAVRLAADNVPLFDPATMATEPRDAFYAALGDRLVHLRGLEPDRQREAIAAMIERCLALGPSGLDAGVFSAALEHGFVAAPVPSAAGYRARMRADRQLRHGLMPLLAAVLGNDMRD